MPIVTVVEFSSLSQEIALIWKGDKCAAVLKRQSHKDFQLDFLISPSPDSPIFFDLRF